MSNLPGWVCTIPPHPSPLPRGEGACSLLHGSLRRARFWSPSYSLRRVLLSRTRGRTPSERRWAMDGPSARAVGQECEPKEPDVSRANKRGRRPLVTLGLSKVTRPRPKGGRNPVEGSALASHAAKPHQGASRWLRNPARVCCRGATMSCGAMRCAYCTLLCSTAW